ncbi:MAG: radical SAM protein [Candidatus Omnitrophota bacterium]
MRVLLLNLPWHENGRLGVRAGSRWSFTSKPGKDGRIHYIPFPFFLAYAAALLKKGNREVRLIDAIAAGTDESTLIEEIKSYNPGLIVVETSTPSFKNDLKIIKDIHNHLPDCQVAISGPHATVFCEQILKEYNFINYILIGEYERILSDLVNCLENNLGLDSILGLSYRKGDKIIINQSKPAIDNLDNLPWPERETLPMYKYNDAFCDLPEPNVQMWASRGCSFGCIFCLWPQVIYREHKYRKRNPVDVVDEMEYLINRFNFKAVYFDDDVFNIDRSHVLNICKGIKTRKIKIPWAAMARADLMDEELLKFLSDAGLYAVKYGIESANQDILNFCKKKMDLSKVHKVIKITKRLGIKVHLTFCLGLPGETKLTIQETTRFIQDVRPDSLQFSFATSFPGTEYFEYLKDRGWLLSGDWSDYDGNYKCIVKTEELASKEIEEIKIALSNNFHLQ